MDYYKKYKVCVSGAAETTDCGQSAFEKAEALGAEIVKQGAILITGATTGFPYWSAKGAKEAGGLAVGVSPAQTEKEHVKNYELPIDYHDFIFYTGAGYAGRNLLLTRLADAVIVGCGRIGTINEFTIAFEDRKPIGILEGEWEADEVLKMIIEKSHRAEEMKGKIIFSSDPRELVRKIIELVRQEKENNHKGRNSAD
ncbi:LOG family protein [Candidatus Wolfebacteria bacterium]|nr:LOG family protein [Candidatus Wolfebacteria bacterium]